MRKPREVMTALIDETRKQRDQYAHGEDRPLGGYLATLTTYSGLVASLALLARATGQNIPERLSTSDVIRCAFATHKLSRLLAKDPVTEPAAGTVHVL